jgi:hypothetical protein
MISLKSKYFQINEAKRIYYHQISQRIYLEEQGESFWFYFCFCSADQIQGLRFVHARQEF